MKNSLFILMLFSVYSFSSIFGQNNMEKEDFLFKQYAFLLERSFKFDHANPKFKYEAQAYIDSCLEYSKGIEKWVSPFANNERGGPTLLHPYLFDNQNTKVILLVLIKGVGTQNKPIENIRFVIGSKVDEKWKFELREGLVRSFAYENKHPEISEAEMSLRVIRNLIDWGYMPLKRLKIKDDFFEKKSWK